MSSKSNYSTSTNNSESESSICSDLTIDWKGHIIQDKYIVIYRIGSGSYCSVWLTYDFINNKEYALKIYNREDYEHALKEIEIFDNLKKLNINDIILYDFYEKYMNNKNNTNNNSDTNSNSNSNSNTTCDTCSDTNENDNIFILLFMPLCGYSIYNILKIIGLKNSNSILNINKNIYDTYINLVYKATDSILNIITQLHNNNYVHTDIKPENILIKKPTLECKKILDLIKIKINNIINKKSNIPFKKIFKKKNKVVNYISELQNFIINFNIDTLNITNDDIINYIFESNNEIILCDMGTTLKTNDRTLLKKHTTYYKAPEIILDLDYNGAYDIWSLGCSIYEMMTGDIMFNPFDVELVDKFGENEDKNLLYLIISTLGITEQDMISQSKLKQVFFTKNLKMLKGFDMITYRSILDCFIKKNIITENISNSNIDILLGYIYESVKFNPTQRFIKFNKKTDVV